MFAMIKIDFVGNDDFHFQGFKIGQTSSVQATLDVIRENLEQAFEDEDGIIEIYHSDNDQTPFESLEEVMDTLSVEEITEAEFNTLKKFIGEEYGKTTSFMEFAD
jgi:hypothetical protein